MCSGLRYLLASATLALLFGYLNFRTIRTRMLFIAVDGRDLHLGNGVRAFIVMTVASATDMKVFGGSDHVFFGMGFFAVLLLLLFWIGSRYADPPPPKQIAETEPGAVDMRKVGAAFLAAVLVLAAGLIMQIKVRRLQSPRTCVCPASPAVSSRAEWRATWTPAMQGADAQQLASYRCGEAVVHVVIVSYVNQGQGNELVGTDNAVVPSEWWQLGAQTRQDLALRDGGTLRVNQTRWRTERAP